MQSDFEQYADEIRDSLTEEQWEAPVPFNEVHTPDFPTEKLPAPLAAMVKCLAESTQTPEEMSGLLSLGVLATAFQSRYEVQITPDWREPLCLYCAAVAPPGERKSAVISALTRPIYEYERQQQEIDAAEIERNRTERELLEGELQAAKTAATKGKGDRDAARQRALELSEELANYETLHECRLLVDDTTPEKLVDLLEQQKGCLTVCSAEGGIFDAMRGRYEKSANLDVYLKAHAGDPVVVDRVGRKNNRVDNPRLTMMLTIQPEVLAGLMNNATFRGRGLCGRFLYAMCKSKVGHRNVTPEPVPDSVRMEYRDFVRRILSAQGKGIIKLSQDADALRCEYQAFVEKKLGDEWDTMRDWGGKIVGAMVRIAALMHCAEVIGDPTETPVSAEVMYAAICIAEYLGAHASAAYQVMGADNSYEDAKYLWRRIESTDAGEISKRDLFNICKGKFRAVAEMSPAIERLADMGYIREATVATGGRPSIKIFVNPLGKSSKRGGVNMAFAAFAAKKENQKQRGSWAEYEARKRELQRRGLIPAEYDARVRALVRELRL